MIVTIWWEDARQAIRSKTYGPDQFLAQCIADDFGCSFFVASRMFNGQPKKGAGTIRRLLKTDAEFVLNRGHLCAVLDHDKILDWWRPPEQRPNDCHKGICDAIRASASGNYYLVLLHENVETLVAAACKAMGTPVPGKSPQERDDVLATLVFRGTPAQRHATREAVPGFNRLVDWVKASISEGSLRSLK